MGWVRSACRRRRSSSGTYRTRRAVDILTKWITKWITGDKLEQELAYLTGVDHGRDVEARNELGTSVNVALAAIHDFFWDYRAIETELDETEWAD